MLIAIKVYFWTTIRKNRNKYNLTRGFSEEDVTAILFRDVVLGKDSQRAETALLGLSGLKKFANSLRSNREKEDFRRHLRKYINIWLPDCPFEVSTTNRYTIVTHEAAITARRFIRAGETIKYLCGNMVEMTPDEMEDLDITRRDFSVVMTSRKKAPALFLGPARFANHDCKANARLVPRGADSMEVVCVRSIQAGEEITVDYGDHYFGEDNCECLCATCEAGARGGWPGEDKSEMECDPATTGEESEADTPKQETARKTKRNEVAVDSSSSGSEADDDSDQMSPSKKRKLSFEENSANLEVAITEETLLSTTIKSGKGDSPLRNVLNVEDIIVDTQTQDPNEQQQLSLKAAGQHGKTSSAMDELLSGVRAAFAGVSTVRLPASQRNETKPVFQKAKQATRAKSDPHVPYRFSSPFSFLTGRTSSNSSGRHKQFFHRARTNPAQEQPRKQSIGTSSLSSGRDSIFDNIFPPNSSSGTTPSAALSNAMDWKFPQGLTTCSFSSGTSSALSSPLSSLTSIAEIDDTTQTVTPKFQSRGRGRPRKGCKAGNIAQLLEAKVKKPKPEPRTPRKARIVQPTIEVDIHIPTRRTPGDYIRTRLLLGESHSRWVDCRTCEACWVQANGYQTRKECPRCERHSKLYGFQWPKTEKAGKFDTEERVMDHRTVHRFIPPEEEKQEMKRGRGVGRAEEGAADSERSESTGDDNGSSDRADSRAGRHIRGTRPLMYTR